MSTLMEQVGNRLRMARQAAGYKTARAFAMAHDIAQSTYSQYETGKRHFSVDVLAQFVESLHINPNWLLFGKMPVFGFVNDGPYQPELMKELLIRYYPWFHHPYIAKGDLIDSIMVLYEASVRPFSTNQNYEGIVAHHMQKLPSLKIVQKPEMMKN